jgi:hypothetical protein
MVLEIAVAVDIACLIWFIWMCKTAPLADEDDEFGFRLIKGAKEGEREKRSGSEKDSRRPGDRPTDNELSGGGIEGGSLPIGW